ncbi:uncharacterized protein [Taeniopygia guttata]|uniref:uncharacterized protein isoform X3 n=1 Tax=Taeniopygia guttata TaxID=59729 RepID=UPI003BB8D506
MAGQPREGHQEGLGSRSPRWGTGMWRGPALRCALLQLPSRCGADFLRHDVRGVGPGQPGTARHGTAWPGLAPPGLGTAPQRQVHPDRRTRRRGQRVPELPAPARMEPTKLPLTKRMAPAPPVPAKTKPAPVLPTKPGDPQPSTSAAVEWGRAGDPGRLQGPCRGLQGWPGPAQHQGLIPVLSLADANGFNTVPVTTARLSHPTATRPRVPGQRPPSMVLGSTGGPHGGEQPQGLPRAALCAPVPSTGQAPVPPWSTEGLEVLEGRSLALEDLKAEVRTLHILVDLMRVQHLRDLQDLRQELCQEQAQRQALQVSPCQGLPRPGVPCAPQQSQPLPTGGDRASEEGAALLAWGGCGAHPWHGAGGWHMALCAPPAWFCTRWIQMPTPHPGTAP